MDRLETAVKLFNRDQFDEANRIFDELLDQDPDDLQANYFSALCAIKLGMPGAAHKRIKITNDRHPEVLDFDFMVPRLKREGKTTHFAIWLNRITQYRRIKAFDGVVISYPKCGRTWLRAMLGNYILNGAPGDPLEIFSTTSRDGGLPTIEFSHDDYPHWKRFDELNEDKGYYKDTNVAFLVRDPRDTLVSYFFQYTRRGDKNRAQDPYFDGDLSAFIRHDIGGLRNLVGFYNTWAKNRDKPANFALFRYEDFHHDSEAEFRRLIEFLELPIHGDEAIARALEFGSFGNLQKIEKSDVLNNVRLKPPEDGDPEGLKVRRGKVGGYEDYLSNADIAYVDQYLADELDDYYAGYK